MENTDSVTVPIGTSEPVPVRRMSRWKLIGGLFLVIVFVAAEVFQVWQIVSLKKEVKGLDWSEALHMRDDDNVITPDVGTIQFMKKGGYSITLDTAKYTGDGLYLHGVVGNPNQLTLTNLSLSFTASKPLYQYQDDYDKDPYIFFVLPSIGQAQTSPIPYLGPGRTETFEVTIPNVKQTKDGIRLVVSFTGERYSY